MGFVQKLTLRMLRAVQIGHYIVAYLAWVFVSLSKKFLYFFFFFSSLERLQPQSFGTFCGFLP